MANECNLNKDLFRYHNRHNDLWHYKCKYNGSMYEFNGVTIAEFHNEHKIEKLCEFQSKSEHCYPYDE